MRLDHILPRQLILAAAVCLIAFISSCSGLWSSLDNPVDPVNCEVEEREYWQIFPYQETIDDVLEQLRYADGYQILYLGFNNGTYASWDATAPFVVITTKNSVHVYEQDGQQYAQFPLFDAMTVSDQMGNTYTANIGSWAEEMWYTASDGKQYAYCIATFYMSGEVDKTQTYTVQIENTSVFANDGTQLDRSYFFVVQDDTDYLEESMDPMSGLSSRLLHDFSETDENWNWRKGDSYGEILTDPGVYAVHSLFLKNGGDKAYFKRYPYQIPEGDFAARVALEYPGAESNMISGLYVCNAAGIPIAVIMIELNGLLRCYAAGPSDMEMRRILQRSIPDTDPESIILALRREGPMMCYCVNGTVFARENVSGYEITNAGIMVESCHWDQPRTVYFDDFEIAY